MRPETIHLAATVARHLRGVLNAVEKFERTVPREHRATEVLSVVQYVRQSLAVAEKTLFSADPADSADRRSMSA